ncbi:MAG: hypothetical protein N3D10_03600 [Candidatus Micrarchaeota archaeon]|nr:hypothetical protein [Candidatus Micrarchaeota archaeon]
MLSKVGFRPILFLFLFLLGAYAKVPGTYFDYIYLSNYVQPQPQKVELNCSFFFSSPTNSCAIVEKVPYLLKESVLLSTIKKPVAYENQEWIRYWNSKMELPSYEEAVFSPSNYFDGAYGSNGSLQNVWIKLLYLYPSVFDEKDQSFYLPDQIMLIRKSDLDFVINNTKLNELVCKEEYVFYGYSYKISSIIGDYQTEGLIIPVVNILKPGEKQNLSIKLQAKGEYDKKIYVLSNHTLCNELNCTIVLNCVFNQTMRFSDSLELNFSLPIKYYPSKIEYENLIAVPQKGFANGVISIKLPKDFLDYKIKIKDEFFSRKKNDIKIVKRGQNYPLLGVNLVSSPSKAGNLNIIEIKEGEDEAYYYANITYRLYLEKPELGEEDCFFELNTPFYQKNITKACQSTRLNPNLKLEIEKIENSTVYLKALVKDQLGIGLKNSKIEFSGAIEKVSALTDEEGIAKIKIKQTSQPQTIVATLEGSEYLATAKALVIIPAKIEQEKEKIKTSDLYALSSIIFLIISLVILLMKWLGKRSEGSFRFIIYLFIFCNFLFSLASAQASDIAQTLEACKNYDFDNAIRHFGECAEAYRMMIEFNSMRNTANILITNIAPLVLAVPSIEPYKTAYANMLIIALALFRVAWAFNSFYLILNIFNPQKRSEALKQYIWLGVFVIIAYFSYSIAVEGINLINQISNWIIGQRPEEVLLESTISAEFLAENYEMLKLTLPFLNLTYLILLSRYILIIGLFLLLPFSLLLFFNVATKGFGKALLGITFMIYFLSIINSILLLIYKMLLDIGDIVLQNTLSSTFFTAAFVIFFGFADLIIIIISILGAISMIGGGK